MLNTAYETDADIVTTDFVDYSSYLSIIKTELLKKQYTGLWEDVATIIPIFYYASKITYLSNPYYHYVQYNSESYTESIIENSLISQTKAIEHLLIFFKKIA